MADRSAHVSSSGVSQGQSAANSVPARNVTLVIAFQDESRGYPKERHLKFRGPRSEREKKSWTTHIDEIVVFELMRNQVYQIGGETKDGQRWSFSLGTDPSIEKIDKVKTVSMELGLSTTDREDMNEPDCIGFRPDIESPFPPPLEETNVNIVSENPWNYAPDWWKQEIRTPRMLLWIDLSRQVKENTFEVWESYVNSTVAHKLTHCWIPELTAKRDGSQERGILLFSGPAQVEDARKNRSAVASGRAEAYGIMSVCGFGEVIDDKATPQGSLTFKPKVRMPSDSVFAKPPASPTAKAIKEGGT